MNAFESGKGIRNHFINLQMYVAINVFWSLIHLCNLEGVFFSLITGTHECFKSGLGTYNHSNCIRINIFLLLF